MRCLAIETSGRAGALALLQDAKLLAEDSFPQGLKHAAALLPRLDALIRTQGWSPRCIEQIFVSVGPGSFTGLRIGVTMAKTLAMISGAKLVAVPSCRVLAHNAPIDAENVLVILDARRGSVFAAQYRRVGDQILEEEPAHLDQLAAVLGRSPRPVFVLGEGLRVHSLPVEAGVIGVGPDFWEPRVAVVAKLGLELAASGKFVLPDELVPLYLRQPEAEEKWEIDRAAANSGQVGHHA